MLRLALRRKLLEREGKEDVGFAAAQDTQARALDRVVGRKFDLNYRGNRSAAIVVRGVAVDAMRDSSCGQERPEGPSRRQPQVLA